MKLPIRIDFDLTEVASEFELNRDQVDQISNSVSKALTIEIHRNWQEAAKQNLKSTRNQYMRGLIIADEGNFTNTITLTGKFNNMLEDGVSAFDMKTAMLKSKKIQYTKAGKPFITVPFRFGTPDALGENEAFSDTLPQEIYDIVKDFKPKETDAGGNSTSLPDTLKAGQIPEKYAAPKVRNSVINSVINKTFDSYTHKSSIFEGIQRDSKTYEGASQSSYVSFRRISENSDPMSWIHSGLNQYNLAQQAIDNTDEDTIINNVVDKNLSDFGF